MNLINLNLEELNAREVKEFGGGMGYNFAGTGVATGAGSGGLGLLWHSLGDFAAGLYNGLG